jgi:hypothetical protein
MLTFGARISVSAGRNRMSPVMNRIRFAKLPRWGAGVYLFCSLLVYFGTLGQEAHAWWPLFLYFIIWPLSLVYELVSAVCLDWLPNTRPEWVWWVVDATSGAFYIVVGTIWIWFLGKVFSRIVTLAFPIKDEN